MLLVQELLPRTGIKAEAVIPSFLRRDLPLFFEAFECHRPGNPSAVTEPAASKPLSDSPVQLTMKAFLVRSVDTPTYCILFSACIILHTWKRQQRIFDFSQVAPIDSSWPAPSCVASFPSFTNRGESSR
jgi:hypothetical protein